MQLLSVAYIGGLPYPQPRPLFTLPWLEEEEEEERDYQIACVSVSSKMEWRSAEECNVKKKKENMLFRSNSAFNSVQSILGKSGYGKVFAFLASLHYTVLGI